MSHVVTSGNHEARCNPLLVQELKLLSLALSYHEACRNLASSPGPSSPQGDEDGPKPVLIVGTQ